MPKMENLMFDTRLIRRNLRDGRITDEQLAKHLKALEDTTGQFEIIKVSADRLETGPDTDRDYDAQS